MDEGALDGRAFADGKAYACKVTDSRYSCMYCNKGWRINDDGFVYWEPFRERHWMVRAGIVRAGDRMNVIYSEPYVESGRQRWATAGYDHKGWFSRCADKEACERRQRNLHNHVQLEHLSFLDEIDSRQREMAGAKEVMA